MPPAEEDRMDIIGKDTLTAEQLGMIPQEMLDPKRIAFFLYEGVSYLVWDNGCYYNVQAWDGDWSDVYDDESWPCGFVEAYDGISARLRERYTDTLNVDGDGI
jgi:hypothetical protein